MTPSFGIGGFRPTTKLVVKTTAPTRFRSVDGVDVTVECESGGCFIFSDYSLLRVQPTILKAINHESVGGSFVKSQVERRAAETPWVRGLSGCPVSTKGESWVSVVYMGGTSRHGD
jgi:hypothetical protein